MESNSAALVHRGRTYSLKELLQEHKKSLTPIEKKIIHRRINGDLSFDQISDDERLLAADEIIAQCVSLYGCKLPQSERVSECLTKEMANYILNFGFSNLTVAEISLAMQFNVLFDRLPSGIEIESIPFTMPNANVSFVAKVLHNYAVIRGYLDRKFQNQIDGYE